MRIDIISAVPALISSFLEHSIVHRAQTKGIVHIQTHDLHEYSTRKFRQIDDAPYGGGSGMVLGIEPIDRCISALKAERTYDEVIFMSPDGQPLTQNICHRLALVHNLIILCGHYKGVDERVRTNLCTMEISIGDYVLSGGELPAAVLADAITRLQPGVLGDVQSALSDSFQDGLLSAPVYTRPAVYRDWEVPEVLRSGHEAQIDAWRNEQALNRTKARRPDLLSDQGDV
ncbi:MAG: tRNA (guanosine(37)-N1)-methyltransferase TrmD [Bacteroidetes bacterium]|jgi:tRNA (guanine37-N1)-methyltransferase|nr:tRNA (guanosine(37)-N1)-methyltransferase TrmD [Bacteroidota bacterium]